MQPQDFFKKYASLAESTQVSFGVPASITLAQSALESAWGESGLTKNANNFFGIKDFPNDDWHGEQYVAYTQEYGSSGYYSLKQPFRQYKDAQQCFNDHATFLQKNSRYGNLFNLKITDYIGWAKGLQSAGYATDPTYASKLINLVVKYNLTQYDVAGEQKKKLNSYSSV
jgi:flagellum-specific peptidoglycan hydrolase FlgJ